MHVFVLLFLVMLGITLGSVASSTPSAAQTPHSVYLRQDVVDMSMPGHTASDTIACGSSEKCQWLLHWIASTNPATSWPGSLPGWLAVHYSTVSVMSYLPHNTYLIHATWDDLQSLHLQETITLSTMPLDPVHKLSPALASHIYGHAEVEHNESLVVHARFVRPAYSARHGLHATIESLHRQLGSQTTMMSFRVLTTEDAVLTMDLSASDTSAREAKQRAMRDIVELLAKNHSVLHMEIQHLTSVRNDDGASLIQSGQSQSNVIHDLGLYGDGQIVGIGDDWLDVNQCFFIDNVPVQKCTDVGFYSASRTQAGNTTFQSPGCVSSTDNVQHRKIAGFWEWVADTPPSDGSHGTHVSGTVGGMAYASGDISRFNGAAPGAKIVFTQLGAVGGGIAGQLQSLSWTQVYFSWSYIMGARIHSNSWGEGPVASDRYGTESSNLDSYVSEQRDMLVLFAAGNDGEIIPRVPLSVEAQSKNALIVGSSQVSNQHFVTEVAAYQAATNDHQSQNPFCSLQAVSTIFACVNALLSKKDQFTSLTTMTYVLCSEYSGVNNSCSSSVLLSVCSSAYFNQALSSCPAELAKAYAAQQPYQFNQQTVSWFSTYGPAADGRIKPDVVASGDALLSAKSHADQETDYGCSSEEADLISKFGTSMATPLVAGSAALVREYYVKGYHVSGATNLSAGIQPSAALMKATLINSAVHTSVWGQCYASSPIGCDDTVLWFNSTSAFDRSTHEGFGRVQLDQVLYLAGNASVPSTEVTVFSYDACTLKNLLSQGQNITYSFTITNTSRPFKAALVWTDPAANPMSAHALVNNLDLTVTESSTGVLYYGNAYIYGQNQSDNINNVEQVWVTSPVVGEYQVVIAATAINMGDSQDYALVVTFADGTASVPSTTTSCSFANPSIASINAMLATDPIDILPSSDTIKSATTQNTPLVIGLSVGMGVTGLFCIVLVVALCGLVYRRKHLGDHTRNKQVEMTRPETFHRLSISTSAVVQPQP